MKKVKKHLLFFVTAMLCLLFLSGKSKITSYAATGDLIRGSNFSIAIKSFTNSNVKYGGDTDKTIKKIIFAKEPAKPVANLQQKSVGEGVTAYFDSVDKTVYVCCKTNKIRFNQICSFMFSELTVCEEIDFGTDIIDTTPMEDAANMFEGSGIKELDLRQFRTPNLRIMGQMFSGCDKMEKIDLSTLDTSKVVDMQSLFMNCILLDTLDLSNFNTSKVEMMFQMFAYCKNLKSLDLSNFDTSNVESFYRMFDRARKLESVNLCNFKTTKVKNIKSMFSGCNSLKYLDISSFDLSNVQEENSYYFIYDCKSLEYVNAPQKLLRPLYYDSDETHISSSPIGNVALDDNKDEIPDSDARYNYFPTATISHRYIFPETIEKRKAEEAERKKAEEEKAEQEQAKREKAEQEKAEREKAEQEKANQEKNSPGNNGTEGTQKDAPSNTADTNTASNSQSLLPMTITVKEITYYIDGQGNATVTKIGKVKNANINSVTAAGASYPVTAVKANACKGNSKITSLTIGKNVKLIGKNAFYNCKKLKNIKITANKSLKIGKKAFKKLNKDASIKVRGIKGKNKKKLIANLSKQTDAIIK